MAALDTIPLLSMRGIKKRFGGTYALRGVDLTVAAGSVHALIGENGAGKSTLMKTLSGADWPDAGEMTLAGKPYRPVSPSDARAMGVCMIYQELALAPDLSVMKNILLGIEPTVGPFIRWGRMRSITREALAELGRPDIAPDTIVSDLSLAEQQLVEIARAVAMGCKLLVLDEPTSSLTQKDAGKLFALVKRLKARGVAIIYISHALEEVKELCDHFTVMRDGEIVGGGDMAEAGVDRIISMMVGRDVDDLYPRSERTRGEDLLSFTSLSGERLPRSATLTLARGEVVGIAGLIGSGRTEMLRSLFGLDSVKAGEIRVGGDVGAASPASRWGQGLGFVSEDRNQEGLAVSLSISDNLTLSKLPFFVDPKMLDIISEGWIHKFRVRCGGPRQPIGDLSGGNQQKIAIARLMEHGVDVLLLDEPTRGIDVGSKAQIYRLIDDAVAAGKAVLVVSSYFPELLGICDRIAVMTRGVLGEARPVAEWTEHSLMVAATAASGAGSPSSPIS